MAIGISQERLVVVGFEFDRVITPSEIKEQETILHQSKKLNISADKFSN
jgi:hypothetical protein